MLREHGEAAADTGLAGIVQSIENLHSFLFVAQALSAGELRLHGAYFGIATGELTLLDTATGAFETVA